MNILEQTLLEVLTQYPNGLIPNRAWDVKMLSMHPNLTDQIVAATPHLNWKPYLLLGNPNLTTEFRLEMFNRVHDKNELSKSRGIVHFDLVIIKRLMSILKDATTDTNLSWFINIVPPMGTFTDEALDWLYNNYRHSPFELTDMVAYNPGWMITNYRPWSSILTRYVAYKGIPVELADQVIQLLPIDPVNCSIIGSVSNPLKYLDEIIEQDWFDKRSIEELLELSRSTELTKKLVSLHPDLSIGNNITCYWKYRTLDDESADKFLRGSLHQHTGGNPSISDDVLYQLLYDIHDGQDNIGVAVDKVMSCYYLSGRTVDHRILELLSRIEPSAEWISYGSLRLSAKPELEGLKWIIKESGPVVIVEKVEDMIAISSTDYGNVGYLGIQYRGEVTDQLLKLLNDNIVLSHKVCWDTITWNAHQDLIVEYPKLRWNGGILSRRTYQPSARFLHSKSARK